MIKLDNINVKYVNKDVFLNQSVVLEKGALTAVVGESGAGKTTLLNIIGLNTFNSETMIVDDVDLRKLTSLEVEKFKEDNIYYVRQTPKFFNDIKIKDYLKIYDENYSLNKDLMKIINEFELNDKLNFYPMQLSGGEKIKFSLILAYLSNANILILDEPTASLDIKSIDVVIKMILKIAENNKYVICSTHNQELIDVSKSIIEIKDGKIYQNDLKIEEIESNRQIKKQPKHFLIPLIQSRKHNLVKNIIKYVLISLIASISLTSLFSNNYAAKIQEEIINDLGATELIIYKPVIESQRDYYTGKYEFPFTESEINAIKQIKHIDQIHGYLAMTSNRSNDLDGNIERKTNYQIIKNNQIINDYTIDLESGDGANTNQNHCDVFCYYPNEKYLKGGVYLSSDLANRIGYEYQQDTVLKTTINVPLYNIYNASYLIDENQNKIPASDTVGKLVEVELPIYGIINNYPDWNVRYGNNSLFVCNDVYEKLIKENQVTESFERENNGSIKQYVPFSFNAYYLKIDSLANFETVTKQLDQLGIAYYSEYADAKQASSAINKQKDTMLMFSVILMIVLLIVSMILSNVKKKDEADMIDYFKMTGLSNRKINKIRLENYLIDTLIISLLMIVFIFVVKYIYQIFHISYIRFEMMMLPLVVLISLIMNTIIPFVITRRYYDKNK